MTIAEKFDRIRDSLMQPFAGPLVQIDYPAMRDARAFLAEIKAEYERIERERDSAIADLKVACADVRALIAERAISLTREDSAK